MAAPLEGNEGLFKDPAAGSRGHELKKRPVVGTDMSQTLTGGGEASGRRAALGPGAAARGRKGVKAGPLEAALRHI
jgi:hypothetical protein